MDYTTNWILKLGDHVTGPLEHIISVQNGLVNKVTQVTSHYEKLSNAGSGAAKKMANVNSTIARIPSSIEELRNKLSGLTAQLETTHSYKSLTNLQHEIRKTKVELSGLQHEEAGGFGGGLASMLKKGLAFAAAYVGISQVMGFAKESLKAFDEEAKNRSQLSVAIKSTKGISGESVQGLEEKAIGKESITLFKHSDIMLAQSQLLVFNKIRGKVFDDAITSAMDLSTRFKIDLPQATKMVGKALEDPIHGMRMLRMAGIDFSDGQLKSIKKLMAQGDLYKVQLAILKGMNESFGGSAEAAAKAGIAPLQVLTNKFHTLKEVIGERLSPTVNSFSAALGNMVDGIKEYMSIPVSDKLIDEKITVVSLADELFQHNITAQRRNDIYEQLKTLAPEVLNGIDKENISWGQLRKNVADYNDELQRSITLQLQKETEEPYVKKVYKATQNELAARTTKNNLFAQAEQYSKNGAKIGIISRSDDPVDQKIRLIINLIKDEQGKNYGKLTDITAKLMNLGSTFNNVSGTPSLKNAVTEKQIAQTELDSVKSADNIVLHQMFPSKSDTTKAITPDSNKKEPKEKIPMGEGTDIPSLQGKGKDKDGNFVNTGDGSSSGSSKGSGSGSGNKSIVVTIGEIKQENHFAPGNYEKKKEEIKQEIIGAIVDAASDAAILASA